MNNRDGQKLQNWNSKIMEMNNGDGQSFKLKWFFKVGTLIDIMKNLGPNLKQGMNCRPFYVISLRERKSKLQ